MTNRPSDLAGDYPTLVYSKKIDTVSTTVFKYVYLVASDLVVGMTSCTMVMGTALAFHPS